MEQEASPALIEDPEIFHDFCDSLDDYAPRIEVLVALLRQMPEDEAAIAELFRNFHNIKGDASMCRLMFLVPFVHAIESLLSRVRAKEWVFTPALADVLLLTMDRLLQTVDALKEQLPMRGVRLPELTASLEAMLVLPANEVGQACLQLVNTMAGVANAVETLDAVDVGALLVDPGGDLPFFRELALQLESRSPLFTGRTERNLQLVMLTNSLAGSPVDPSQLAAAVYVHDVGMMFLAESLWLHPGNMTPADRQKMRHHVDWGGGLLARMAGWPAASRMVLQHHEKPDGSGYPHGLRCEQIDPGAKILALVDAFEAVVVKQGVRGQARSILRAAAEVNAAEQQFDKDWVGPFNLAVRQLIETRA